MGSERGELASSQDQESFNGLITSTMDNQTTPVFIRPFTDRMIEYEILPEPEGGEYSVNWPEIVAIGEKDQATILKDRMDGMSKYLSTPGGDMLIPPEVFLRDEMGYDQDQIDEIQTITEGMEEEPVEVPEEEEEI